MGGSRFPTVPAPTAIGTATAQLIRSMSFNTSTSSTNNLAAHAIHAARDRQVVRRGRRGRACPALGRSERRPYEWGWMCTTSVRCRAPPAILWRAQTLLARREEIIFCLPFFSVSPAKAGAHYPGRRFLRWRTGMTQEEMTIGTTSTTTAAERNAYCGGLSWWARGLTNAPINRPTPTMIRITGQVS